MKQLVKEILKIKKRSNGCNKHHKGLTTVAGQSQIDKQYSLFESTRDPNCSLSLLCGQFPQGFHLFSLYILLPLDHSAINSKKTTFSVSTMVTLNDET